MIHLKLLVFILFKISFTEAIECKLSGKTCIFSGIRTSEYNLYFNPSASDYNAVHEVLFLDSVMPILTDELCKVFPNLKVLELCELSIQQIAPKALHACRKLTNINFYDNKLEKLDPNLFEGNPELDYVNFQGTRLREIDGNMFVPTKKLEQLILGDNFLTKVEFDHFPKLEKLEVLDLFANELVDLDEQDLLRKFPSLEEITLHNNLFDCDRLRSIIGALHENYVEIIEWEKNEVERNSHLTTIDNVECVQRLPTEIPFSLTKQSSDTVVQNDFEVNFMSILFVLVPVLLVVCLFIVIWKIKHRPHSAGETRTI